MPQPTADALRAKAVDLRGAADEQEAAIGSMQNFVTQLGDEVAVHGERKGLKKGQSTKDLFQAWDKNGNSHLSRMEFRVAARELKLDGAKDSSKVDELFKSLDKVWRLLHRYNLALVLSSLLSPLLPTRSIRTATATSTPRTTSSSRR